jgi:hypothetical protein
VSQLFRWASSPESAFVPVGEPSKQLRINWRRCGGTRLALLARHGFWRNCVVSSIVTFTLSHSQRNQAELPLKNVKDIIVSRIIPIDYAWPSDQTLLVARKVASQDLAVAQGSYFGFSYTSKHRNAHHAWTYCHTFLCILWQKGCSDLADGVGHVSIFQPPNKRTLCLRCKSLHPSQMHWSLVDSIDFVNA